MTYLKRLTGVLATSIAVITLLYLLSRFVSPGPPSGRWDLIRLYLGVSAVGAAVGGAAATGRFRGWTLLGAGLVLVAVPIPLLLRVDWYPDWLASVVLRVIGSSYMTVAGVLVGAGLVSFRRRADADRALEASST